MKNFHLLVLFATVQLSHSTINSQFHQKHRLSTFNFHSKVLGAVTASFLFVNPPADAAIKAVFPAVTPPDVVNILKDGAAKLRSEVTGEKIGKLRVGESLTSRLKAVDLDLDDLVDDVFRDPVDWEVLGTYPKIFRAYSPLLTAYTDRAFPTQDPVDVALRYALRYEIGAFYNGVKDLETAIDKRFQRQAQRAVAKMSLSYDHYLKAGDLFDQYDADRSENTDSYYGNKYDELSQSQFSFIAPSIEAPGLQDEIVLTKGPDKGRVGTMLWISKGEQATSITAIVKFQRGASGHSEVKAYPYSLVAKTTPPDVLFMDDFLAAYVASVISCAIMYPIDSYKTRMQSGRPGWPKWSEGGPLALWEGVGYFTADPNDAIYVATYGYIKPAFLAPIDINNPFAVFCVLVLSGSVGDAIGSVFRVPLEVVTKQIQTGAATNGFTVLRSFLTDKKSVRLLLLSWVAILCRDMPFAGLQIALFDVFKGLLAGLDDLGVSIFVQRALWGALAGGTAAVITTPFDVLTTSVMTAAEGSAGGDIAGSYGR